jgi:U32 family peptidase
MTQIQQKAKNFKILAPAGDWESLRTAVTAGADSVYFGIADFNMRATAARNFTFEDLKDIALYCNEKNVETCITVNTIMYNSDLETMKKVIDAVKDSGCSAVIVADISALQYANKVGVSAYVSTQMSVSNIETVKFFSQYTDRIILARELTLEQVKEIVTQIEEEAIKGPSGELVEIEIFGHGALCVAVSGRCSMSLYCYDSSANKGKCTQVCRRAYKVTDLETGKELVVDNNYIMSPKDLCTIGMLKQVIDTGTKVLKIEGRGRPAEYVDTVVRCYKEAVNSIIDDTYTEEKVEGWNKRLNTVFNRGLSSGLYMGRDTDEWAKGPGNQASMERILVGKVLNYYPQQEVVYIKVLADIEVNDGEDCLITGDTTGLVRSVYKEMLIDTQKSKVVKQGDSFTMKIPNRVRKNDQVFVFRNKTDIL